MLDQMIQEIAAEVLKKIQSSDEPRLLSTRQAAKYLGRSPASVLNLMHNGTLTPVRLEGSVKLTFDRRDLDQIIEDAKTGRIRLRRPAPTVRRPEPATLARDPKPELLKSDHAETSPQANPGKPVSADLSRPARKQKDQQGVVDQVLRWGPNV